MHLTDGPDEFAFTFRDNKDVPGRMALLGKDLIHPKSTLRCGGVDSFRRRKKIGLYAKFSEGVTEDHEFPFNALPSNADHNGPGDS